MVEGVKRVTARPAAKGSQEPDLKDSIVDTSGRVSIRPSHRKVVSPSAREKWVLWSPEIKNALPEMDGFSVDVFLRAPEDGIPRTHAGFGNWMLQRMA